MKKIVKIFDAVTSKKFLWFVGIAIALIIIATTCRISASCIEYLQRYSLQWLDIMGITIFWFDVGVVSVFMAIVGIPLIIICIVPTLKEKFLLCLREFAAQKKKEGVIDAEG